MRNLLRRAARGIAVGTLSVLFAVSPEGNAQEDRYREQTQPAATAKKVSRLIAALQDRSYYPDQYRAAKTLGQLGPAARDAIPALAAALKDPEPLVRMAAAGALVEVGSLSREALLALKVAAKDDKSAPVREAAAEAYEDLLAKATLEDVPVLVAALKDTGSFGREAATRALGKVSASFATLEALAALAAAAQDVDPHVRLAASEACERLVAHAAKQRVPTLIAALKDSEPFVRRVAARALGKTGSPSPEALAALKVAARDENESVREAASESYRQVRAQLVSRARAALREDVPALAAALKAGESHVREAAAGVLGAVGYLSLEEALAALKGAARDDDREVRRAATEACESLLARATREDVPALLAALRDSEPFVRRAAARALGAIGYLSPEALVALKAAARDRDPAVRRAATEACKSLLGRATRGNMPALVTALKDTEPFVRLAAARVLGEVSSPSASAEALAALKAAARDDDLDVRRAATEAWERIPATLKLQVGPILELQRGTTKSFRLQVYRHKIEGPVLVQFDELPGGVRIPEVTIPADRNEASFEVTVTGEAPGTEQEARVRAGTAGTKTESQVLIYLAHVSPLVEGYLRLGRFAEGEAALVARLKDAPRDDQTRFGLGMLRFVRGIERLGQALHKYGARSENTNIPFLRLPVPANPKPELSRYTDLRRFLADFHHDLSAAEATLAGVNDEEVKLPLRLALIRLDLDGDGEATDEFMVIVKKIFQRRQLDFLESNPDFLVCFDRGDVAWLRAYCHLLMGMLDFYLALDTEPLFDQWAGEWFARAQTRPRIDDPWKEVPVKEPARLGKFRRHFLKVAELNRETWKYIRAEKDDDHEWLPNPRQKGVLGLPVRNEMIDAWLAMMAELEALLDGNRTLTSNGPGSNEFVKEGKGLNLKTLLDDPPEKFIQWWEFPQNLPEKYFSERKDMDVSVLFAVIRIFGDPTALAYAAWFN